MKETFEIINPWPNGTRLIVGKYKIGKKAYETKYIPRSESDDIQFAVFEDVKRIAENCKNYGKFKIELGKIKSFEGSTSGTDYISGRRSGGFVGRTVCLESRENYGGPCYFTTLKILTNKTYPDSADFSFNAREFKNPKDKKKARKVLKNLLVDVLQLKILQPEARDVSYDI